MRIKPSHIAVFVGLYTALGFVAWIIRILADRARWCSIPAAVAKETGQAAPAQDCTVTLGKVIDKLGDLGMVLVGCFALGILLYAVVQLGAYFKWTGPLGWGGEAHGDDQPDEPK